MPWLCAEDLVCAFEFSNRSLKDCVFAEQGGTFAGAADGGSHYVWHKRLGKKVEGAVPHTFNGKFHGAHRGEENHGGSRIGLLNCPKDVHTASAWHLLIRDHNVKVFPGESG